jgi:GT2 family glycosyltransferase
MSASEKLRHVGAVHIAPNILMPQSLKIAAVFATMNRAETAKKCVLALARQSRPPDLVVVADNCSTDDTVAVLQELADLPFKLVVRRLPENRGNAGGVEEVMDQAFEDGADAVWILDDDSWPREAALAALLDGPWDPRMVRHPLQIDPQSGKFTWPLQITDGKGGWRLVWSEQELPPGPRVRSRISWTGALVPREVREVVGPVNGDLFIRGEDEEYPWRIEQAGFPQEAICGAVMDHPGPQNVVHWRFFGKNFFFERGLADWKIYYKVRNMIWLKRRQSGNLRAIQIALTYTLASARIDGPQRLPLIAAAARDGWTGRLGKWKEHPGGKTPTSA